MFYYGDHDIKVLSHSEARAVNELIELARNLIYDGFLGDWDTLHREVLKFIPALTAPQQGVLSSSGLDLEAAIRLALETLKAEQRLITAQALAETTQSIAELCWYHKARLTDLAAHLKISEAGVSAIRESDAYLAAVETLIYTTRSPAEIQDWIQTYPRSKMPKKFGKRMGLAETVVSQLIEKVLEGLKEAITPENTPPLRSTTQTTLAIPTIQADICQTIATEELLNIENMNYPQIRRAVAEKRIQRYASLSEAAASLGIDTRTLKSYANWQKTDP